MICPNLSDSSIRAEFTHLSNLVGEDFAYFVWNKNGGYPLDKTVIKVKGKETVVDNPLYKHFLDSYNNVKQATLATAIFYSKKLHKNHPNFKDLPVQEQANIIHSFVQENETLEKASERVMKFVAQGFKAERVISENLQKVAFDEARKIANGRQLLDSYIWFKSSPLSQHLDFVNMQNKEESSFATWTKSAIILYKGSDYSDLYHEGWHEFTQRFMTKEQRTALYQTVKSRPSTVNINGTEVPYYSLTNRQIEEVLAEEFRDFALNKSNPEVVPPIVETPVRNVFQRIWDFLTDLFIVSPQEVAQQNPEALVEGITGLFEKLYSNQLSEYKPNASNISEKSLNRNKAFQIEYKAKDGRVIPFGYNALEAAEIFSAIDYFLADAMDNFTDVNGNVSRLDMSFLLDTRLKSVYLPKLYESARDSMLQYISALQLEATTADEATALVLNSRIKNLKGLVVRTAENDGWSQVVKNHQKNSKGGVFYIGNNINESDVDNRLDEMNEENFTRDSRSFANAEDVDPMTLASPEILQLIKTLPGIYYNNKGELITATGNSFGLPQAGDFLRNKNLILNKVSGSINYEEALQRLRDSLDIAPQLQNLIDRLPKSTDTLSLPQMALKAQFMQFATMPTVSPYEVKSRIKSTTVKESKDKDTVMEHVTFLNNTLSQEKLIEYFDQNFVTNRLRKYRITDSSESTLAVFDSAGVLTDYSVYKDTGFSSHKAAFEFLNDVFGIDLIGNRNPNLLFNKKGELQFSVDPVFTPTNTRNILRIANNALFKLNLISMLPSEITAPTVGSNPLLTLSSDLSKQLKAQIDKLGSSPKEKAIKEYVAAHFKFATLDNERTSAFSAFEKIYNISNSASYISPEGNLEYAVREWNHLLDTASKINSVENIYDLSGHLNSETNNFLEYSLLMKKMFRADDGTRKSTTAGEAVELRVANMSGYTIGTSMGDKTTNLTGDGKLLQDFISFKRDAIVENMRVGAKSSSFATSINGNKSDREYFPYEEYNFKNKTVLASSFVAQMQQYLYFEAMRMFDDKAQSNRKEILGSDFIIFKDMIPESMQDRIKETINVSENKAALKGALLGMFGMSSNSLYGEFKNSLTDYFTDSVQSLRTSFIEILSRGENKDLAKQFNRLYPKNDGSAYTDEEINSTLMHFATNYYAHQVELLHLLIGDPSNFKIKNGEWREVFKRLGAAISPGKQPRLDSQDINSWNNSSNGVLSRGLEELQRGKGKARAYDNNLNYVQYEDVKTFEYLDESTRDSIRESMRENYLSALVSVKGPLTPEEVARETKKIDNNVNAVFAQDEEANAQAYSSLDFIRFYLNSIGEWLPQLEQAYKHELEVFKAIKTYRNSNSDEDKAKVYDLIEKSNLGILTSLKLGYYGSPTDYTKYNVLGKYSVFPLSPSMVFDTDLEGLMMDYLDKGVDLATFSSGNKMSTPTKELSYYEKKTVKGVSTYVEGENGELKLTKVDPEAVFRLPIDGLRRQQYIAPKTKNEVTLSTQMVKLIFSNFYVAGEMNPQYAHLTDKINALQSAFIENVKVIVDVEKAKIYSKIGATVDDNGNITAINTMDFTIWLENEFDKKDVPTSVYSFLRPTLTNSFVFSLDAGVQRSLIDQIISSALSKRVLKPKLFGEAYIQLASTGFNKLGTRMKKPTTAQLKTIASGFNVSGLRDYRIENGVVQPADVLIPFNPKKHSPLLNLTWNGERIATLDRLNKALEDDAWVTEHSAKITIVGVRIPVQGLNSMEHFRVRRFLSNVGGPVMVVPPSIVTKSGSDFDIDKLFMYEPELDDNGNLVSSPRLNNPEFRAQIIDNILAKNEFLALKAGSLESLFASADFKEAGLVSKEIETLKKFIDDLREAKKSGDTDAITEFKENIGPLNMKLSIAIERFKTLRSQDPKVVEMLKNLVSVNETLADMKDISEKALKGSASNNMISVISSVLSEPSIFTEFTKPNTNVILPAIAAEYQKIKGRSSRISSSAMFLIETSVRIFTENNLGKKSLSVDAKVNALHKLYQQTGLRFKSNPEIIDLNKFYLLKANKNKNTKEIELGGLYDADGINLISDVINEFINGHVDIEKEDWINFFNADRERTPLILQMVLNGTPVEEAILLVNQPIVQHYIRSSKITKVGKALGQKPADLFKDYIKPAMDLLDEKPVYVDGKIDEKLTVEKLMSTPSIVEALSAENFNKTNYPPNPNVYRSPYDKIQANRDTQEGKKALKAQLAFIAQYYIVQTQNQMLLELTTNIDFNTANYRINTEFYSTAQGIIEASDNFNPEGINRILENSVVSPFNILDANQSVVDQVWDFFSLDIVKQHLHTVKNYYGKYWGRDKTVKNFNQLMNSMMLSFFQNTPELKPLYAKYGPDSGLLDTKAKNNLRARFDTIFNNTEDSKLRTFANNNIILNNFTSIMVEGTTMFYPGMLTNEKDVDTVNAGQKDFADGLNHPNPEVRGFFSDLANTVLLSQGSNIKYRSIHNFIPMEAQTDIMIELSIVLKKIKESIANPETLEFLGDFLQKTTNIHSAIYWPSKLNKVVVTSKMKTFPDFTEEPVEKLQITSSDDLEKAKTYAQESSNDAPEPDFNSMDEEFIIARKIEEKKAKAIASTQPSTTPQNNDTLFGIDLQNQGQLEFHVNTLNVVTQFLENIGVEQRLVPEFLSEQGSVVEGAIAAANFINGTVDIIDDLNKRPEAWNKLPEEAAHFWYRLLDSNSPLKDALLTASLTDRKEEELRNSLYGSVYTGPKVLGKLALDNDGNVTSKPALSAIKEEAIGQLIAEAIKRIENKNANTADYSFFKKFLEWINSVIKNFKNTTIDPFEVAAMKILSSDMSDLMTWAEYSKLNNIVNFADVLTEQSVAPVDYTLIEDIGVAADNVMYVEDNTVVLKYGFVFRRSSDYRQNGESSPAFSTQQELDNWVSTNVPEHNERQKAIIQEVRDNQAFFDRLLNKSFRKKSKFLPKTLRKYFNIVDSENLYTLEPWNVSQELEKITKKLSDEEKEQLVRTNGYTNIAPTLKVLPNLLQKYKKNPIVLSETIKLDGAKKQELSILDGIRKMIKSENPNLKSITAEDFVQQVHEWLNFHYLLGFADENTYLSYRVDQTFTNVKDRSSDEDFELANMTEAEIQALPFAERQRIATTLGLTKQNPDVYHNKVSLRFNDKYHLKSGHFNKSPSAWGNLTYFYTGKNKWKDRVLLHEIQNDNIEFLREYKSEKVNLETSLGRYLQDLNETLLGNIAQIESSNARVVTHFSGGFSTYKSLNALLDSLKEMRTDSQLTTFKQRIAESIELYKSDDSVYTRPEKAQKTVDESYAKKRKFADFKKRGGIRSLLNNEELVELKNVLSDLNNALSLEAEIFNIDTPVYAYNLKEKKAEFKRETIDLTKKINSMFSDLYGEDAPLITLSVPAKRLSKNERYLRGTNEEKLNESVDSLLAFSEIQMDKYLSKDIWMAKRIYNMARNANTAYEFNLGLSKITANQFNTLMDNFKYNQSLLAQSVKEQSQKDLNSSQNAETKKAKSIIQYLEQNFDGKLGEYEFSWANQQVLATLLKNPSFENMLPNQIGYLGVFNWSLEKFLDYVKQVNPSLLDIDTSFLLFTEQQNTFTALKQKALDKKEELEKDYGKVDEEVKQTLDVEMNYFTPLVHHLIQKHINQYGKDFPMYFSGFEITKLTQNNDRTALIYAGKDEVDIVDKNEFTFNEVIFKQYQGERTVLSEEYDISVKELNKNTKGLYHNDLLIGKVSKGNNGLILEKDGIITQTNETQISPIIRKIKVDNVGIVSAKYEKFEGSIRTLISKQEYEKAYQQATERRAKEIKFEAILDIGILNSSEEGIDSEKSIKKLSDKELEVAIKKLNEYKKQSKQNLDRVVNTIMNISNSKPIETGAIYNAMTQVSGVKLIWENKVKGLKGEPGGYKVDLSNYNYNTPVLYGLQTPQAVNLELMVPTVPMIPIDMNTLEGTEFEITKCRED